MLKKFFAATVLMAFMAPAWAHMCPALMADIDAALQDEAKVAQLSEDEMAQVNELRERGEQYHNAGDHAQSEEVLNEAKAILGV